MASAYTTMPKRQKAPEAVHVTERPTTNWGLHVRAIIQYVIRSSLSPSRTERAEESRSRSRMIITNTTATCSSQKAYITPVPSWIPMLTTTVTTKIPQAMRFIARSLGFMAPREGMKFDMTVQTKAPLLSFASWSPCRGMELLRSTDSLVATAMRARVVALREKNLQGNQSIL
ncbi:unnamed protein product [Cuscuta campestris]|uniref:Uncharacterized protein n=1 Tax=Cuscuta campestris TaxID=132261 RepID=A0A484LER9_9ASTE|nr:unnamed protein product [Cuscuta campestris]